MDVITKLRQIWGLWVQLFPDNDIIGRREHTAAVAFVIVLAFIGWLIRKAMGEDPGIR